MSNENGTKIGNILGTIIILAVVALVVALAVYHFNDCKKVGHTKTYCVIDLFR